MIEVTVVRENGRTLLTLNTKGGVRYEVQKKLEENRFYIPDTNQWWIWRGPDTDRAEQAALEIAETYNQKHI